MIMLQLMCVLVGSFGVLYTTPVSQAEDQTPSVGTQGFVHPILPHEGTARTDLSKVKETL